MAEEPQDAPDGGEAAERGRAVRAEIVEALRRDGNWFARKRRLMTLLETLEVAIAAHAGPKDLVGPVNLTPTRGRFIDRAPAFLAQLLDELGETEVTSCEQAAFYLLSANEAHQQAATAWIESSPKHAKALRNFVKANRWYRRFLDDDAVHS